MIRSRLLKTVIYRCNLADQVKLETLPGWTNSSPTAIVDN